MTVPTVAILCGAILCGAIRLAPLARNDVDAVVAVVIGEWRGQGETPSGIGCSSRGQSGCVRCGPEYVECVEYVECGVCLWNEVDANVLKRDHVCGTQQTVSNKHAAAPHPPPATSFG